MILSDWRNTVHVNAASLFSIVHWEQPKTNSLYIDTYLANTADSEFTWWYAIHGSYLLSLKEEMIISFIPFVKWEIKLFFNLTWSEDQNKI